MAFLCCGAPGDAVEPPQQRNSGGRRGSLDAPSLPQPVAQFSTGLRQLFHASGIIPTVVSRADSVIVNVACISEGHSVAPSLGSAVSPVPSTTALLGGPGAPAFQRRHSLKHTQHPAQTHDRQLGLLAEEEEVEEGTHTSGHTPQPVQHQETPPFQPTAASGPGDTGQQCPADKHRSLGWSDSRRHLAVLVLKEEHFSKADPGIASMSSERRLSDRLERLNLDMIVMQGDGNCQFRTLSFELYGDQQYHLAVRKRVIQYIRTNREDFACFLGQDFDAYVTAMSKPGTWGDELTLRAACDEYRMVVNVVTSEPDHWYLVYEPKVLSPGGSELFLTYIAPVHYNAIRRKASLRRLSHQLSRSFRRMTRSSVGGASRGALCDGQSPMPGGDHRPA